MAAKYDRAGEQNNSTQDFILISRNEEAKALFQRIHRNKHNIATLGLDVESVELGSSVVIHDPRNDSRMLYETFQTEMRNVFDTQTFQMTVENQSNQALTTRRLQCQRKSLDFIYEKYVGRFPNQKLTDDMKSKMSEDQTIWLRRPLTRDMALYAALDVETLLPIRVPMSKYLTNMDDGKRIAFLKTYNELCAESIYTPLPFANAEINIRKSYENLKKQKVYKYLALY